MQLAIETNIAPLYNWFQTIPRPTAEPHFAGLCVSKLPRKSWNKRRMPEPAIKQLERIVSGGQTGVDRTALDVAIEIGLSHGGWCPLGRRAEDGLARKNSQPCFCLDLADVEMSLELGLEKVNEWMAHFKIKTLNIAGPRESSSPGISSQVKKFLTSLLGEDQTPNAKRLKR